jgi:hypothetical protein
MRRRSVRGSYAALEGALLGACSRFGGVMNSEHVSERASRQQIID